MKFRAILFSTPPLILLQSIERCTRVHESTLDKGKKRAMSERVNRDALGNAQKRRGKREEKVTEKKEKNRDEERENRLSRVCRNTLNDDVSFLVCVRV